MKLKIINNRYRYARINAGYSQIDVVNILGYITKGALSSYERGTSLPSNKILYSLSKLYNASLDYLVKEDNYMNHEDFVKETMQSKGIGKKLLNHAKEVKSTLKLRVYQRNEKAIKFYLRENFCIQSESVDDNTGEKEFVMIWNK